MALLDVPERQALEPEPLELWPPRVQQEQRRVPQRQARREQPALPQVRQAWEAGRCARSAFSGPRPQPWGLQPPEPPEPRRLPVLQG